MKLARPYRMAPLAIATALAAELTAEAADRSRPARSRAAEVAAARVPQPAAARRRAGGDRRGDPGRPAEPGVGRPPSGTGRSVNVEFVSANPTGPLHVGNARGAFIGDLLSRVLEAGGQRVTREYYFNDSGAQIRQPRRVRGRAPARRAGARGRLPGRLRPRSSRPPCPDDVWAAATRRRRRYRRRSSVSGRPVASAKGSRPASSRARRAFRRLDERGAAPRRGLGRRERSSACASAGTSTSRTARSWFRSTDFGDDKDRVIYPVDRRADLLRGRHRLRHREVRPRLRPPHLHLGRRPPRDGRARPQRRRGDGLRPRGRPGPALFVGPLRARRPGGLDEQARGRVHHPRRAAGRGRRRRRPLVLRLTRGARPRSTSTSSWPRSSRTRTPSTTSSTRTPGSPRSCARPPTPGWRRPTAWPARLSGAPEAAPGAGDRPVSRGRRGRGRGRGDPGHHGLRDRAGDRRSTASIATRGSWTPTSRSGRRHASRWRARRGSRWRTRSALLGISAPESM